MMNRQSGVKVTLLLAIVAFCFFEFLLHRQSHIFFEFEAALLSLQLMLLVCLVIWCGTFLFVTFSLNDLPLIGLLFIVVAMFLIGYVTDSSATDAITLLFGLALGKGARFLLYGSSRYQPALVKKPETNQNRLTSAATTFLIGLIMLLGFASWWHLDVAYNFYPGTRWTGLWDNPNIYGMLMSAGVLLTIGLLATRKKEKEKRKKLLSIILFIALFMMGVGLFFSYSRGAWLGTAIGLLYLAKAYGKFKWKFVLPGIVIVTAVVCIFWSSTPNSSPWYVKRMDFGRASAQHRVAAWKASFEMMRDHPFGVGWNKSVETYEKNYHPPENGAAAITTNDYLMLGTQLGLPGLICFMSYIVLCLKKNRPHLTQALSPFSPRTLLNAEEENHRQVTSLQDACRAGALAMLTAFWFDGGLFKLATASFFWILLELGRISNTESEGEIISAATESNYEKARY